MQTDSQSQASALGRCQLRDRLELLAQRRRRLAPAEVHVHVTRGDPERRGGGAAEVDGRGRGRQLLEVRPLDRHVLAVEVDGLAAPEVAHDSQELGGARVAAGLLEAVPERALFLGVATGDHVQQQPATAVALERRCHLCGERRADQAGAKGDHELEPLGPLGEHCGRDPSVVAPQPRRRERAVEAQLLGGKRDLGQVAERGGPRTPRHPERPRLLDQPAPVALSRQEPVKRELGIGGVRGERSVRIHTRHGRITIAIRSRESGTPPAQRKAVTLGHILVTPLDMAVTPARAAAGRCH